MKITNHAFSEGLISKKGKEYTSACTKAAK